MRPRTDFNDKQNECYELLCDLVGGEHHIEGKVKPFSPWGIVVHLSDGGWATYDSDFLTRMVFMCHERCIRAEIGGSGPRRIKLALHKRDANVNDICLGHPTIEQALEKFYSSQRSRKYQEAKESALGGSPASELLATQDGGGDPAPSAPQEDPRG